MQELIKKYEKELMKEGGMCGSDIALIEIFKHLEQRVRSAESKTGKLRRELKSNGVIVIDGKD